MQISQRRWSSGDSSSSSGSHVATQAKRCSGAQINREREREREICDVIATEIIASTQFVTISWLDGMLSPWMCMDSARVNSRSKIEIQMPIIVWAMAPKVT